MPLVTSNYKPPFIFKNGYVSTIYSGLCRKVNGVVQERERITLTDGDFIDIDWSFATKKTDNLIIVLHGLEGNAERPYMLGTAKIFNDNNVDAACVNFRGCSGEENLKYRSYHSGVTEDLHEVVQYIVTHKHYKNIFIKGFSLGGNVTLKYLGENKFPIPKQIKSAVAVSVPCLLHGSCIELHKLKNKPYAATFLKNLKSKLYLKQEQFPKQLAKVRVDTIKTLKQFDDVYTSKAHGFKDAIDYYTQSSSLQFLHNISIPTLLINAKNDSFLSTDCYPYHIAETNPDFYFETPKNGGHVGFYQPDNIYYNEKRAVAFLLNN